MCGLGESKYTKKEIKPRISFSQSFQLTCVCSRPSLATCGVFFPFCRRGGEGGEVECSLCFLFAAPPIFCSTKRTAPSLAYPRHP